MIMMSNGPINWRSKQQISIAKSSMEAYYMALCVATQEAIWLRQIVGFLPTFKSMHFTTNIIRPMRISFLLLSVLPIFFVFFSIHTELFFFFEDGLSDYKSLNVVIIIHFVSSVCNKLTKPMFYSLLCVYDYLVKSGCQG